MTDDIRALGQHFFEALQKIAAEDDAGAAQLIACEALSSAPSPISPEVGEDPALLGVAEVMEESGGAWRPCSGCYDTEDGHPTQRYPFSKALGCDVGCGCHECGGLGATWEHWTEEDLAAWEAIGEEVDAEHAVEMQNDRFRHAIQDAIDMLLERKQGNPARSASHNARVCLQFALTGDVASLAAEGLPNV